MNYELVKKLKDAGFPQKDRGEIAYGGSKEDGTYWEATLVNLEELIEACGDKIKYLTQLNGGWKASTGSFVEKDEDGAILVKEYEWYGKTPIEAVAHLWLALNNGRNSD